MVQEQKNCQMNSRYQKNKAVRHQNEIRNMIRSGFYGVLEEGDVNSRPMNNKGSDIILSPKALAIFPFYIECKRYEDKSWKYSAKNIYIDVVEKAKQNGLVPLLIRKKNFGNNQFYSELYSILNMYPKILIESGKSLKDYSTINGILIDSLPSKVSISSNCNIIHFGEAQFFKLMSCLKKSYFQSK